MQTTLGDRLAIARKRAGLSQDQLADKLGAGRNAVSAWENNERLPEGKFLLQLPGLLDVSADWLLLDRGPPTLPREALEALRDWANRVLPPEEGGKKETGGNGGDA